MLLDLYHLYQHGSYSTGAVTYVGGIEIAYNAHVMVNGVDLSDHAQLVAFNLGPSSVEATQHGDTARTFRPHLPTFTLSALFLNDDASGSVNQTLRTIADDTDGFTVVAQPLAPSAFSPTSTANPKYSFVGVMDGDLLVMDDAVGEVPLIGLQVVAYSDTLTVTTTSS